MTPGQPTKGHLTEGQIMAKQIQEGHLTAVGHLTEGHLTERPLMEEQTTAGHLPPGRDVTEGHLTEVATPRTGPGPGSSWAG